MMTFIVLAQQQYFQDAAFINYLSYLKYWKEPEYIKYIQYVAPFHALFTLCPKVRHSTIDILIVCISSTCSIKKSFD
jgi:hypothetical protein